MASSVSLIPPQELRARVLASGTDLRTHLLCWEGSAARLHEARLVLNRSDMTTEQKIHTCCQKRQDVNHSKHVLGNTKCIFKRTCRLIKKKKRRRNKQTFAQKFSLVPQFSDSNAHFFHQASKIVFKHTHTHIKKCKL